MSIFAFAHGVVGELNNIAREKAEKIRKEEDRADDFDYAVRLAREQGDIQLETKKKEINLYRNKILMYENSQLIFCNSTLFVSNFLFLIIRST